MTSSPARNFIRMVQKVRTSRGCSLGNAHGDDGWVGAWEDQHHLTFLVEPFASRLPNQATRRCVWVFPDLGRFKWSVVSIYFRAGPHTRGEGLCLCLGTRGKDQSWQGKRNEHMQSSPPQLVPLLTTTTSPPLHHVTQTTHILKPPPFKTIRIQRRGPRRRRRQQQPHGIPHSILFDRRRRS